MYDIAYMCNLEKNTDKSIHKTEIELTDIGNKLLIHKGEKGDRRGKLDKN